MWFYGVVNNKKKKIAYAISTNKTSSEKNTHKGTVQFLRENRRLQPILVKWFFVHWKISGEKNYPALSLLGADGHRTLFLQSVHTIRDREVLASLFLFRCAKSWLFFSAR